MKRAGENCTQTRRSKGPGLKKKIMLDIEQGSQNQGCDTSNLSLLKTTYDLIGLFCLVGCRACLGAGSSSPRASAPAAASQAGHHTHQTITCVQTPQTRQPKVASAMTSAMSAPIAQHTAANTSGGEISCNVTWCRSRQGTLGLTMRLSMNDVGKGPSRESGAQRRPMKKESEKLTVARVARKMPRRSREKDLRRRICCGLAWTTVWMRYGRMKGTAALTRVNTNNEVGRFYEMSATGMKRWYGNLRLWLCC